MVRSGNPYEQPLALKAGVETSLPNTIVRHTIFWISVFRALVLII